MVRLNGVLRFLYTFTNSVWEKLKIVQYQRRDGINPCMAAASGKKLIQTVIHNSNATTQMQSITARMVLSGAAAAGTTYHFLQKEMREMESKMESKMDTLRREMESKTDNQRRDYDAKLDSQRRDCDAKLDSQRRDCDAKLDSQRRDYDAKLETTKSSWWSSWFG